MKKRTSLKNTLRTKQTALYQVCNLIPSFLLLKAFEISGVKDTSRTFCSWSHVLTMVFAQITGATSLNDLCDNASLHATAFTSCRRASTPRRNTLSHANRNRDASFIEALLWELMRHLESASPGFGRDHRRKGYPARFRSAIIHAFDSTTIQLVATCMDWASHRRRKAACKLHMNLSIGDMMPRFAVIDTARQHDSTRAIELCAPLRAGEIALFDRAYLKFSLLLDLTNRGVFWVIRSKTNTALKVVKKLQKPLTEKQAARRGKTCILRDDLVILQNSDSREEYPQQFRRVTAWVEVDGKWRVMVFLTNNLDWAPMSVAELYAARWSIEVFFKQVKGMLKLKGFLGTSLNAIQWQIWSALITYVLLRYLSFLGKWRGHFVRVLTLLRSVIWDKIDFVRLLEAYGTAGGPFEPPGVPTTTFLKGFEPKAHGTA